MGKIVKDGFTFVAYANSRLIRNVDDIPELKHALISLGETKTHIQMAEYALLLGEHILQTSGLERTILMEDCFAVIRKWQAKEARFQDALEIAGQINDLAREEKDQVRTKALRAMGQVAATPHVRWHPLVASEYAMVMTNLMYPKDFAKAKEERELQIALMEGVR